MLDHEYSLGRDARACRDGRGRTVEAIHGETRRSLVGRHEFIEFFPGDNVINIIKDPAAAIVKNAQDTKRALFPVAQYDG